MLVHWIWLATRPSLNQRQQLAVLEAFSDPEDAFFADRESYARLEGFSDAQKAALADKDLQAAEKILTQCTNKQIRICTFHDSDYPSRLKHIADPPLVLYYKGELPDMESSPVIAAVGTREASPYGQNVARRIGYQIASCGGILVSGIAKGIDGMAMEGALLAGKPVVGVLGSGVDIVYPKINKNLFADTERHGCLISEFPPETPPYSWNFPKRNRIISGLCNGVVVIEAPEVSGSLITARRALDQGRDVFVVPGNVDVPGFDGSNALLREGATAVRNGWDIMEEYAAIYPEKVKPFASEPDDEQEYYPPKVAQKPITPRKKRTTGKKKDQKTIDNAENKPYIDLKDTLAKLSDRQRDIVELLTEPRLVDDIVAETGIPAAKVAMELTVLEVKGIVKRLPGNRITLK